MKLNTLIRLIVLVLSAVTDVKAQKKVETFYFNTQGDSVSTKAKASYYRVVQTSGKRRITTEYDSTDMKLEEISYRKDKGQNAQGDSVWWKYGSFRTWFPSGQLRSEGSFILDRLHDNLKAYYPNGVLRRNDVYYIDTLRQGHCYAQDSTEIAHFPYIERAEFMGGQLKMFQFLGNTTVYPAESRESSVEGTVYVGFVVSKTGDVENVKIKRSVDRLLDEEAIRVVKSMPKWKAGKLEGELVRTGFTLPILFKLE